VQGRFVLISLALNVKKYHICGCSQSMQVQQCLLLQKFYVFIKEMWNLKNRLFTNRSTDLEWDQRRNETCW